MKALLLILGVAILPASGIPVTSIQGGYLNTTSGGGSPQGVWQLVSGTFSLTGSFGNGNVPGATWVGQPGQLAPVSAVISGADIAGLNGLIDGVFHDLIGTGGPTDHYASNFTFVASPVTAALGTTQFAFTFTGFISARGSASGIPRGPDDCILCNVAISGSGTGTVSFAELFAGSSDLRATGVSYRFDTPEPGEAGLFAAGLGAILLAAKARRGKLKG
jgi:hypothetical protein